MSEIDLKEELSKKLRNQWLEDKPYVFISYASRDWEKVYPIIIALRNEGFNVYIDSELQEVATRNWLENIRERLFDSKIRGIISFLSINYMRSYACMIELLMNRSEDMIDDRGHSLPVIYVSLDNRMGSLQDIKTYIREESIRSESIALDAKMQTEERSVLEETLDNCKIAGFENSEKVKKDIDKIKNRHDIAIRMEKFVFNCSIPIQMYGNEAKCVEMLKSNFINTKNKDINLEMLPELRNKSDAEPDLKRNEIPNREFHEEKNTAQVSEEVNNNPESVDKSAHTMNDVNQSVDKQEQKQEKQPQPNVANGQVYRVTGRNRQYDARYLVDGDKFTVLKGSKINYSKQWTPSSIYNRHKEDITSDGVLMTDIVVEKISTAAKFIEGVSTDGKHLLNPKNIEASSNSPSYVQSDNKDEKKPDEKNQISEPVTSALTKSFGTKIEVAPNVRAESLHDMLYTFMENFGTYSYQYTNATNPEDKKKYKPDGDNWLYNMVKNEIPPAINSANFLSDEKYYCKAGCGNGNWATCPWIAVFNLYITCSTTEGVYIVYLLDREEKELYLTLNQGMTSITKMVEEKISIKGRGFIKEEGYSNKDEYIAAILRDSAVRIRKQIGIGTFSDEKISTNVWQYDVGCICSKKYTLSSLPSDEVLFSDLANMLKLYDTYFEIHRAEYLMMKDVPKKGKNLKRDSTIS